MATKSYEFNLWAAKDDNTPVFLFNSEPYKKVGTYLESNTDNIPNVAYHINKIFKIDELNLTNVKEPHKFRVKFTFMDLPNDNQKQEIMPENSQTPLEQAKAAVHFHSDCKLLTKEEYEELCKYKDLYLDLKGNIEQISNTFKDK